MKKNKKAAIEIQFNWVFVLITGAVILIAFFSFIMKQKATSDEALAESMVKDIAFLAQGAASASKAWQTIEGTSKSIESDCSEDCSCTLSVGSFSKGFGDLMLFVPSELSGQKLVFWSQDWAIPFRTTNFLYMSSKKIKYWLVYKDKSDPLIEEITSVFPKELYMQTISIDELNAIEDEDFETIKIIFINSGFFSAQELQTELDEGLEDIEVKGLLIDRAKSQLTFYEKTSTNDLEFREKQAPFAGLATMLGAIFSKDKTMYTCQVETALQRAETVIKVYAARTDDLKKENLEECNYDQAATLLQKMVQNTGELSLGISDKTLNFPITDLRQINRDLLNQGCPLIY